METLKTIKTFYNKFVSKVYSIYFCRMNYDLNKIVIKVKALYQKYGIKSITMDDVARELGISKKTLYQYVKDKSDLVEKVLQIDLEERNEFIDNLAKRNLNAIDELFEINKHVNNILKQHNPSTFYDLKKYYPTLLNKVKCDKRKKMYDIFMNNIIKGKKENLYRKEINEEIIVKFYLDRMENTTNSEVFSDKEIISSEVFYELFIYHIHGIANANGIKSLYKKIKELKPGKNED